MSEKRAPDPAWVDKLPRCRESCWAHDGKRCELLGRRPDTFCEPALVALVVKPKPAQKKKAPWKSPYGAPTPPPEATEKERLFNIIFWHTVGAMEEALNALYDTDSRDIRATRLRVLTIELAKHFQEADLVAKRND